jgi:hypothetical protein
MMALLLAEYRVTYTGQPVLNYIAGLWRLVTVLIPLPLQWCICWMLVQTAKGNSLQSVFCQNIISFFVLIFLFVAIKYSYFVTMEIFCHSHFVTTT